MFNNFDKRGFLYWFAHWCAFQMTAINCGAWKPRFLLHDFEKPWLELVLPHEKVRKFHKAHSNHHLTYKGKRKIDYTSLVIDWECSRYTKSFRQENAVGVLMRKKKNNEISLIQFYIILDVINELGLS